MNVLRLSFEWRSRLPRRFHLRTLHVEVVESLAYEGIYSGGTSSIPFEEGGRILRFLVHCSSRETTFISLTAGVFP